MKKNIFSGLVLAANIFELNNVFILVFTRMDHIVESNAVEDLIHDKIQHQQLPTSSKIMTLRVIIMILLYWTVQMISRNQKH